MRIGPFALYRQDLGDYMHRWVFVHPLGTVRVHRILRADADRELHTHPFDFVSFILRGGYDEERPAPGARPELGHGRVVRRYRAPWVNVSRGEAPHRIARVLPGTWTLVFSTRRLRSWGFWTEHGFVDWRQFEGAKGYDMGAYRKRIAEIYG